MQLTALVLHVPGNEQGMRQASPSLQTVCSKAVSVVYGAHPDDEDDAHVLGGALGADGVMLEVNPVAGINRVIQHLQADHDLMLLSADAVVSPNWILFAQLALQTFAAVGPVGPTLTGSQRVNIPDEILEQGNAAMAQHVAQVGGGRLARADSLDHCCIVFSGKALAKVGQLDENLSLEWALLDWFVRLRDINWQRPATAVGAFGGRLRPSDIPERGAIADRLAFYEKYRGRTVDADHKLFALFVVSPGNRHQLALLKRSLQSVKGKVDGVAVVCVGSPSGFNVEPGPKPVGAENKLVNAKASKEADALLAWMKKLTGVADGMCQLAYLPAEEEEVPNTSWLEAVGSKLVLDGRGTWALRMVEGELLEDVSPVYLQKLMRHPDPSVVAYNVGLAHHWCSEDLVRLDSPYGDGGDRTGSGGMNDMRLYRPNGSKNGTDGARVANLRLRNIGLVDARYHRESATDRMQVARWSDTTRIGAHQLCYSGEDPDDLARWFDWLHGLTDHIALIWTEEGVPSPDIQAVQHWFHGVTVSFGAAAYGVDFAAWRNEGLRALTNDGPFVEHYGRPTWGLFFDPDEWVLDPVVDLMPFRRMAESTDLLAYTVDAVNRRVDGPPHISSSIRFHRLDIGLEFHGRVHESFARSMRDLEASANVAGRLRSAPVRLHNRGTGEDPDGTKKTRYRQLVHDQLADDPTSVTHWISAAWAYLEDGHVSLAEEALDQACRFSVGSEFLAWYERAMLRLRMAKVDLQAAYKRLQPGLHQHTTTTQLLRAMGEVPDLPTDLGTVPDESPFPFPVVLAEYEDDEKVKDENAEGAGRREEPESHGGELPEVEASSEEGGGGVDSAGG